MKGVWGAGVLFLVAGILLGDPVRNPSFTKYSLGMSASAGSAVGPLDDDAAVGSWDEALATVGQVFPEPSGDTEVRPFLDVESLLEAVRSGLGECSTWTEAFMVLCASRGFTCREWADIPQPGTPASGHAVVDVWVPELQRWGMIDVFLGFWVANEAGEPLSAPEFEERMLAGGDPGRLVPLDGRTPATGLAEAYYADPRSRLAEIVNNQPERLMGHWTRRLERINKPVGQLLQQMMRIGPQYRVTEDRPGEPIRRSLASYRWRTSLGLVCLALALLALGVGFVGRRSLTTPDS